jgi:peptidyl-prolyl cis-trans isomerase SurA
MQCFLSFRHIKAGLRRSARLAGMDPPRSLRPKLRERLMPFHSNGSSLLLVLLSGTLAMAAWSCSRLYRDSPKSQMWARVNGTPIYESQVDALYRRATALPDPGKVEQGLSFKLNILNELIDHQLLLQRAAAEQIKVSDAEVDAKLEQIRDPDPSQDFERRLENQGLTLAELRKRVRQDLIIQKLVEQEINSRITVSKPEIANYYAHNLADFRVPEPEYHLAQILVTPVADPQVRNLMRDDAKTEQAARRKIRALYAQLRAGEGFAKVAEEYSEDPRTAPGGGDMGFIPASALASYPQIQGALRFLKPGQFSGIIHGRNGFCIIKLLGFVPAGQRSLSDPQVQQTIRKTLLDEKEEVLKAAYVEDLRNRAHIVDKFAQEIVKTGGSAQGVE